MTKTALILLLGLAIHCSARAPDEPLSYARSTSPDRPDIPRYPRHVDHESGSVTTHAPQFESWGGLERVTARQAVAVTPADDQTAFIPFGACTLI